MKSHRFNSTIQTRTNSDAADQPPSPSFPVKAVSGPTTGLQSDRPPQTFSADLLQAEQETSLSVGFHRPFLHFTTAEEAGVFSVNDQQT